MFADDGRSMGLVVDEIIDIVEERLRHRGRPATAEGILGSAVIKGQATEVIDVGHFLPMAFADWFSPQGDAARRRPRSRCCWSTTRAFFRNMLAPGAEGGRLQACAVAANAQEGLVALRCGPDVRRRR